MEMKKLASLGALLLLGFASLALAGGPVNDHDGLTSDEADNGWRSLFDGKTLDGWGITGLKSGWAVENGAIACNVRGGGMIYSNDRYKDFMFRGQFKHDPRVNSGIFVRWEDLKDPVQTGMEIQILDSFGKTKPGTHDCGALYDIMGPSVDAVRPAGEWNDIEITCYGPMVRVVLNSQQVINLDLTPWNTPGQNPDGSRNKFKRAYNTMVSEGHIGFQDHGGRVWFRNLRIKTLASWKAPASG
jgi:hypothetical protein